MARSHIAQHLGCGCASEVPVVESIGMMRIKNFGPELSPELRTGGILSGPKGTEEFIGYAGHRDMEDYSNSRLGVVEEEIAGCARGVALVVEIVTVDEQNSLE